VNTRRIKLQNVYNLTLEMGVSPTNEETVDFICLATEQARILQRSWRQARQTFRENQQVQPHYANGEMPWINPDLRKRLNSGGNLSKDADFIPATLAN